MNFLVPETLTTALHNDVRFRPSVDLNWGTLLGFFPLIHYPLDLHGAFYIALYRGISSDSKALKCTLVVLQITARSS